MIQRLALLCLLTWATAAAETVMEDAGKFWRLPLPDGWSDRQLTEAMQGRLLAQAMAQNADGKRFLAVTVRPDGRKDKIITESFAASYMDAMAIESEREGVRYQHGAVKIVEWDGLKAAEIPATVGSGDERKGVLFRLIAANDFIYQIRAIQEGSDEASDPELISLLEGFRLTKRPPPPITADQIAAVTDGGAVASTSGEAPQVPAPEEPTGNPLIPVFIGAGVLVMLVLIMPLVLKRRSKRSATKARGATTKSHPKPANVRTTVKMTLPPASEGGPTGNSANVRKRPPRT